MIKNPNNKKGFTLVELLVAITLFSIAISIAIGGFVRALRTQRELISLIAANSNASLAIEQMAREIRTGVGFSYTDNCSVNCSGINFTNANGEVVTYDSVDGHLERGVGIAPQTVFQKVTADNVDIKYLNFYLLSGVDPARVTISLGIGAKQGTNPELQGNITAIQTTISSRSL
jgi:prepilin-type N-terminal cleavage/methylation domain-containing protein